MRDLIIVVSVIFVGVGGSMLAVGYLFGMFKHMVIALGGVAVALCVLLFCFFIIEKLI